MAEVERHSNARLAACTGEFSLLALFMQRFHLYTRWRCTLWRCLVSYADAGQRHIHHGASGRQALEMEELILRGCGTYGATTCM